MTPPPRTTPSSGRRDRWRLLLVSVGWLLVLVLPAALIVVGRLPPGFALVTLTAVVSWGLWRIRTHAATLILVFLLVALLGTIASRPWLNLETADLSDGGGATLGETWASEQRFDGELPIVLHVVFDELMSPGGIDPSLPGGRAAIDAVHAMARAHGLRLYDSIYSRFYYSGVSLPNLIHAEYTGETAPLQTTIANPGADSAYFADMSARGYHSAVFQTEVLNFCSPPSVSLCETFPSHDPGVVSAANMDERTRSVYLWDTLFRAYEPGYLPALGRWFIRRTFGLDLRLSGMLGTADRFDVQGFALWFDRFTAFVSHVPRGSHVFAHFLVPHSPYLLNAGCVIEGEYDSGYRLAERVNGEEGLDRARRTYYGQYLDQMRCVVSQIDAFLSGIESLPAFDDAVIVIHGDHGSRISAGSVAEKTGPRDMVDNYAAFFAVRAPGVEPGVDCVFTSLPQIFRHTMRGEQISDLADPLPVLIASEAGEGVRLERPMPPFGCATGSPSK